MNSIKKKESQKMSNRNNQHQYSPQAPLKLLLTSCAFHPAEKITNFCTNKEYLLPLCPKCVKIHTDEHIKMGIFAEFNTIEASFVQADQGLKSTVLHLGDFQKIIVDIRRAYDEKIASQKKGIRDAKNKFIGEIQRIFDQYEKAFMAYESNQNKEFIDELYASQDLLGNLAESCQKAIRRLSSSQTVLQGIINYYSETGSIRRIDVLAQSIQRLLPQTLNVGFYPTDLQRIQSMIKRYIDVGRANQGVWNLHKALFDKESPQKQFQRSPKQQKRESPLRAEESKQESPIRRQQQNAKQKNKGHVVAELNTLESSLNLARFKSPLDNFSLTRLRNENRDYK